MATEVSELELRVKGTGIDATRRQLGRLTNEGVSGFDRLKATIFSAKGALAALGSVLAFRQVSLVIGDIVRTSAAFESRLSNVATLIEGDSSRAIATLRQGILNLMDVIPKDADDLGAAAYQIFSAGITDSAGALRVLEASAKLAVAGLGSTTEAVDIVTSALNAYGISTDEAQKITNIFFKTVRTGKTTVGELAAGFGNVAAIAATYKVSLAELQAATAALTTEGTRTAEAQTRIRAAIIALINPTKQMEEVYEALGIRSGELALANQGLVPTLRQVIGEIKRQGLSAAETFGRVEGLSAALSLSGNTAEKFDQILKELKSDIDALGEGFDKKASTIESKTKLMSNAFAKLKIVLGDVFGPLTQRAIEDTTASISFMSETLNGLAILIQAISPVLRVVAGLATQDFELIKKGFKELDKLDLSVFLKTNKQLAEDLQKRVDDAEKAANKIKKTVADLLGDLGAGTPSKTKVDPFTESLKKQEQQLRVQIRALEQGDIAALQLALQFERLNSGAKISEKTFAELTGKIIGAARALEIAKFQAEQFDEVARRLDQDLAEIAGAGEDLQRRLDEAFKDLDTRIPDLSKTLRIEVLTEPERRIEDIRNEFQERIDLINRWRDAAEKAGQDVTQINQRAAELSGLAAQSAMNKMKDAAEDTSEFMRRAFERGFDAVADALTDLLDNGASNFEDFAEKIRKTINRLVADQLTLQLRDLLAGKGFGAPGVPLGGLAGKAGDFLSGLFGGGVDKRVGGAFEPSEKFGGKTQMDFLDEEFGRLLGELQAQGKLASQLPGPLGDVTMGGATATIEATAATVQATATAAIQTAGATAQAAIQSDSAAAQAGLQSAASAAQTGINSTQIIAEASIKSVELVAIAAINQAAAGKAAEGVGGGLNPFSFFGGDGMDFGAPGVETLVTGMGFRKGGIVGATEGEKRLVRTDIFKSAQRFQEGGIAGLKPGEVPIIAHRGERVLSVEDSRELERGRGGAVVLQKGAIQINARDAESFMKLSESEIAGKFERSLMRARQRSI